MEKIKKTVDTLGKRMDEMEVANAEKIISPQPITFTIATAAATPLTRQNPTLPPHPVSRASSKGDVSWGTPGDIET